MSDARTKPEIAAANARLAEVAEAEAQELDAVEAEIVRRKATRLATRREYRALAKRQAAGEAVPAADLERLKGRIVAENGRVRSARTRLEKVRASFASRKTLARATRTDALERAAGNGSTAAAFANALTAHVTGGGR